MKTRYFNSPQTLEELKKQYRELARKHHPDNGGRYRDNASSQRRIFRIVPEVKGYSPGL